MASSSSSPGPNPANVSDVINVRFFPRELGALPYARWPRGARLYRRVIPRWLPVSSIQTKRPGSMPRVRSRQAARFASLRSRARMDFFSGSTRVG
jgi:hypothetical protein